LHRLYIEPFFGAGGMFFNKPKAKYNMLNDLDGDVFNLFQVVMNQKEELEKAFYIMPIHSDLLNYWKKNEETEPIKKALRFLFLSNLTFMGKGSNMRYTITKEEYPCKFISFLKETHSLLFEVNFANKDSCKFIKDIQFKKDRDDTKNVFIYCMSFYPYSLPANDPTILQKLWNCPARLEER
jgi:DNA adenine methylase